MGFLWYVLALAMAKAETIGIVYKKYAPLINDMYVKKVKEAMSHKMLDF